MKSRFVVSVIFLLVTSNASAQSACDLTAWMKSMPAHTQRTPEIPPTELRDTVLEYGGTTHKISLPPGFTMTLFATLGQCRGLTWSPDSVLYATSYRGTIYALPDHDHNGVADSVIAIASNFSVPHGIGFFRDSLYVSDMTDLFSLSIASGSRVSTGRHRLATFPNGGHISRNFVVDSQHAKLYVQVGSASNMDTTDLQHRATIQEISFTDGAIAQRTFAKGLRNAVGMDFDPRTGVLWANCNGMDNIFGQGTDKTNNNPSEGVYMVCDGANYGWPFAYAYQMRNPVPPYVSLADTNMIRSFSGPVAEVLAHSAPLGLHFYRGSAFPPLYHNAIFQCYHGSWDRSPPAPPRITVMWSDSDGRNAHITDFVNGFQPDSSGTRWARVVSVIEGTDGALYVSADSISPTYPGAIFRIAWTGSTNADVPTSKNQISVSEPIPNPAQAEVTLSITLDQARECKIEFFDETGKQILTRATKTLPAGTSSLPINTSQLPSGSYLVRVTLDSEVFTRRLVISR